MSHLERARTFFRAIEAGEDTSTFFTDDAVQTEFPNRLVTEGATRDVAALRAAAERGKRAVRDQRYEIVNAVEQGDELALEVKWSATLNVPLGSIPAGGTMRAHFAVFITFREGLIVSQRNYDCFEPF